MGIFLSKFYNPDKDEGLPIMENDPRIISSNKERLWLNYLEKERNITIQRQFQWGRDKKRADGYDAQSNTIFEFLGCYYHGCDECYRGKNILANGRSQEDLYKEVAIREAEIKIAGYNYESIWECQFDMIYSLNKDKFEGMEECPFIQPREGFYGGRTEPFMLYTKALTSHKDFQSHYPNIMRNMLYPVSLPKRMKKELLDDIEGLSARISNWELWGIAKVDITPPNNLYIPVLPERKESENGYEKLFFDLLPKKGKTYPTMLLKQALDNGYKITRFYDFIYFDKVSTNIFKGYIDAFFKIKAEKSGWKGVTGNFVVGNNSSPEFYIDEYGRVFKNNIELDGNYFVSPFGDIVDSGKAIRLTSNFRASGIDYDWQNVQWNEGLRNTVKIYLNSLWGKFVQRGGRTEVVMCDNEQVYYNIMFNPKYIVSNAYLLGKDNEFIELHYKMKKEAQEPTDKVSVITGIFTTGWGEYILNENLLRMGKRAIYCDTDAIRYTQGGEELEVSDALGKFSDENGGGSGIFWISTGPKSFVEVIRKINGDIFRKTKIKGITLSDRNLQVMNEDGFKKVLLGGEVVAKSLQFLRNVNSEISIEEQEKKFSFSFDKREIKCRDENNNILKGRDAINYCLERNSNLLSYPFGYDENLV
jgi:hypothetical protein